MNKRGQIRVIIITAIIVILVCAIAVFVYLYFSNNRVDCGNGVLKTIDGKKVCVYDIEICGNNKCEINETKASCAQDCKPENLPYSFFAVHFEIDPACNRTIENPNKPCGAAEDKWQNMVEMVRLSNQYNVPLTIMFWPGSAEYALSSPERMAQVREWQAQGHEIGIHSQGCWGVDNSCQGEHECYKEGDNAKYSELAGDYGIQSGTSDACEWLLPSYIYEAGGRFDGRNARAVKFDLIENHPVYGLNIKAGYVDNPPCGGTQAKINQYNTLKSTEIYGFANHGEGDLGNMGGTIELKKWLEFLYKKDPEGSKRMTLRNIMEKYVILNNLIIVEDEVCSSTDSRIQQCLPLAEIPEKSGVTDCRIEHYDTKKFNFGRCIQTGNYCGIETAESCENDFYCPQTCIVKEIGEFNSSSEQGVCNI